MFRSVAEDPPLTEKPEMLQMSLLRLVFMEAQEADWNQISRLLGNPMASKAILNQGHDPN